MLKYQMYYGGDKSLETKHVSETKRKMGSTVSIVMFGLDFEQKAPVQSWSLAEMLVVFKWPKVTKLLLQVI